MHMHMPMAHAHATCARTCTGEPKAHAEIASKYGVRFGCVAGACAVPRTYKRCDPHRAFGAIFIVLGIDPEGITSSARATVPPQPEQSAAPLHGIEMLDGPPLDEWRRHDPACRFVRNHRFTYTTGL